MKVLQATAALGLAAIVAGCAGSVPPAGAMPITTTIMIVNSGATNLIGYRIAVGANGHASYVSGAGQGTAALPDDLMARLTKDVTAARPLTALPAGSCMKSASFGTSLYVSVAGERSSDLSCPGNDKAQAVADDVAAIANFLHVENVPRGAGHELPPQNF